MQLPWASLSWAPACLTSDTFALWCCAEILEGCGQSERQLCSIKTFVFPCLTEIYTSSVDQCCVCSHSAAAHPGMSPLWWKTILSGDMTAHYHVIQLCNGLGDHIWTDGQASLTEWTDVILLLFFIANSTWFNSTCPGVAMTWMKGTR